MHTSHHSTCFSLMHHYHISVQVPPAAIARHMPAGEIQQLMLLHLVSNESCPFHMLLQVVTGKIC